MSKEFKEINIESVIVKDSIRDNIGDITTLEDSIKKLGILCPIIIDRNNILISGERRLIASKNIKLATVPALKMDVDFDSMTALDIKSSVNLCRQPLSADDLNKLIDRKKSAMTEKCSLCSSFLGKLKKLFSW